jgi:hypothetical protein
MKNNKTYKCTFLGLTKQQALILAKWYEGQGEQSADEWFDIQGGDPAPITDSAQGYYKVLENGDVEVYCK